MSAQISTPPVAGSLRPMVHAVRFANVATDVAMTIAAAGVDIIGVDVKAYTPEAFYVDVQVDGTDTTAVDVVAGKVVGRWLDGDTHCGRALYARRGFARFGGEAVRLTVFTGRPAAASSVGGAL